MNTRQNNAASRKELRIIALIVRVIIGGLLSAVVLTIFALFLSASRTSATFGAQNLEAWIPLLGQSSWPAMMRVGNILELTGDACGRALLIALLVALPPLHASRARRGQAPASSIEQA